MTDVGMPAAGTTQWGAPPIMVSREHFTGHRALLTVVGLAAGVVGFVGFFVNFFNGGGTSLASASSGWFDLIPIFIGLGTLGLFMPRLNYFFSGLPLISLGIAFGMRGFIAGISKSFGSAASKLGYGTGFWMICIGAGVLTLCALFIIGGELRERRLP